jgi:ABC-type multidrug transport system fused ATPase/permease subunit
MKLETPKITRLINRLLEEEDQQGYRGKAGDDVARLWHSYLYPHRFKLLLALSITCVWAVHPYVMNLTARFLVDKVLRLNEAFDPAAFMQQLALYKVYVIILVSAWLIFALNHWLRSWLILKTGQEVVYGFRKALHEKLQTLHIGFFERQETGGIMSRVLDDVNVVRLWSTSYVLDMAAQILRLILGLIIVLVINWKLGLLVVVSLPLYGYAFAGMRPFIKRSNIAIRRLNSSMYGTADERISGIAVVKAFSQERRERRSFARMMNDYVRLGVQLVLYQQGLALLAGILTAVTTGLIIYLGVLQIKVGNMTLGDVIVFVYALPTLFAQVSSLTVMGTAVQAVLVVIKRLFNILDEEGEIISGPVKIEGLPGDISFNRVTFTYPGQEEPALRDVTFTVPAGAKIAIMGPSGSGKSTLFQLLERFYDPQEGAVVVGGVNMVDAEINSIHSFIRMVQQEPAIFSGTIAENITYGFFDATPSQIMEAARQAELHDFIMSLPVKYETIVGQNGISLSGGQKQRLSLSTALLTRPHILLLDDTTSALDAETEARVRSTLDRVLEGRTSLIITQRIATARDCDTIIVLENGGIAQMGNHDHLVEQDGFYRRIFEHQESL